MQCFKAKSHLKHKKKQLKKNKSKILQAQTCKIRGEKKKKLKLCLNLHSLHFRFFFGSSFLH